MQAINIASRHSKAFFCSYVTWIFFNSQFSFPVSLKILFADYMVSSLESVLK